MSNTFKKGDMPKTYKKGDSVYLVRDYLPKAVHPPNSVGSSNATQNKVYTISSVGDDNVLKIIDPANPFIEIETSVEDIVLVEKSKLHSNAAKGGRRLVRTRRRSKRRAGTRRRRA